jgi:hypothetical protein
MNYNLTIFKHEQTIMHLKDEVLVAQDKLYKTGKSLENSKRPWKQLWRKWTTSVRYKPQSTKSIRLTDMSVQ